MGQGRAWPRPPGLPPGQGSAPRASRGGSWVRGWSEMTPAHPHATNLAVGAQAHCPTLFPISASLGVQAGSHWGLQRGGKHPVTVVPPALEIQLGQPVQATGNGRPSLRAPDQPEPQLRATVTALTGHRARDSGLRPTAAEGTVCIKVFIFLILQTISFYLTI